ncbi:MAG: porin [Gemmatimonadales bacterium]|nr:porin [Gemmatimonadales bacterium]
MHARLLMGALVLGAAPALHAQAPNVRVSGRMQAQYRLSSGDSSGNFNPALVSNGFEIRRLRIQTDVRFGDNMLAVIQPSFEMGGIRMRDAYLRVGLTPQIGVTIGQEKSPFQRYELTSSNTLPSVERGVRILRLSGREGLNDLLATNGYASHDLGAFMDWTGPENRFSIKLGVQNGSRESTADVNSAKSFFGRATATLTTNAADQPMLQVGVSLAARDRAICSTCTGTIAYYADSSKTTTAFGLDLEWGGFRPGFHVIADFATGDNVPAANRVASGRNTANLRTAADSALRTFMGFSLIGAYRVNTAGADTRLVKFFEPALRVDYLDPDTDTGDNEGVLITPALSIYFGNTVVLRAGFDFYSYRDATGTSRSAKEIKFSWQANF